MYHLSLVKYGAGASINRVERLNIIPQQCVKWWFVYVLLSRSYCHHFSQCAQKSQISLYYYRELLHFEYLAVFNYRHDMFLNILTLFLLYFDSKNIFDFYHLFVILLFSYILIV